MQVPLRNMDYFIFTSCSSNNNLSAVSTGADIPLALKADGSLPVSTLSLLKSLPEALALAQWVESPLFAWYFENQMLLHGLNIVEIWDSEHFYFSSRLLKKMTLRCICVYMCLERIYKRPMVYEFWQEVRENF